MDPFAQLSDAQQGLSRVLADYGVQRQRDFLISRELQKQKREDDALATKKRIGSMYSAGDATGARKAAAEAGDFDLLSSLEQMDEKQRKAATERVGVLANIAAGAKDVPYEQRRAFIMQRAPALKAMGYTDDQLATFDPSDQAIDAIVSQVTDAAEAIKAAKDPETIRLLKAAGVQPGTPEFREAILGHVNPSQFMEFGSDATGRRLIQTRGMGAGGGDPASGVGGASGPVTGQQIEQLALNTVPGLVVTSRQRSPSKNAAVGGVSNSYHLTDQARDFVPPRGMTTAQLAQALRGSMPGFQVIDEGDHVHVEPATRSQGGGGPRVIMETPPAPKQQYRVLTPQEVARIPGLDPNRAYQISPDNQITAVGGTDKGQLKPWPGSAMDAKTTNDAALTNIAGALSLFTGKGSASDTARGAVGFGTGMLGDRFTQWNNPDGTDARARIGQIGGLIIKDTSGAAVSLAEDQRLAKWVPLVTDEPRVVVDKLKNLQRELMQRNQALVSNYSEDQGYRPFKSGSDKQMSPEEAAKLPPGTSFIGLDGKRRVRR